MRRKGNPLIVVTAVVLGLCCLGGVVGTLTDGGGAKPDPTYTISTPAPSTPETTEPAEVVETTAPEEEPPDLEVDEPDLDHGTVSAGAYCDTRGARGVTKKGTRMVCKGPGRLRWRSA